MIVLVYDGEELIICLLHPSCLGVMIFNVVILLFFVLHLVLLHARCHQIALLVGVIC